MPDQLAEEPDAPRRKGGPASPEGKATSSMNRLTHGCCSEKVLLPGENPDEFQATLDGWSEQYEAPNGIAAFLVQETAQAHWLLLRARRRLADVERELPFDPNHWLEADEKRFDRHTRYKTTAERAFFRHFRELEAHFDRLEKRYNADRLARIKMAAVEAKWLSKQEEQTSEKLKIEQYVEVEIVDGQCKTSCYPANAKILEKAAQQPKLPILVKRWIWFPDGVPAEYAWLNPNEIQKVTHARTTQTMLYSTWLEAIEKEKATGHLGPVWR